MMNDPHTFLKQRNQNKAITTKASFNSELQKGTLTGSQDSAMDVCPRLNGLN